MEGASVQFSVREQAPSGPQAPTTTLLWNLTRFDSLFAVNKLNLIFHGGLSRGFFLIARLAIVQLYARKRVCSTGVGLCRVRYSQLCSVQLASVKHDAFCTTSISFCESYWSYHMGSKR